MFAFVVTVGALAAVSVIGAAGPIGDAPFHFPAPKAARRDKCRETVQREMRRYRAVVRKLTDKISSLERDLRDIFDDKRRHELLLGELRGNISSHAQRVRTVMDELGTSGRGRRKIAAEPRAPTTASSVAYPKDCDQIYMQGWTRHRGDHVIDIKPDTSKSEFKALCHHANQRGWIVIQRRTHGFVSFNRGWEEYKKGFGNLSDEFWLGNERIHQITVHGNYTLRFEMEDLVGSRFWAEYKSFVVEDEVSEYRVRLSGYSGDAGDSLLAHRSSVNGARFSTYDRDNDAMFFQNCADVFMGGWWYNECRSHINGEYAPKELQNSVFMTHGVVWSTTQQRRPLQSVIMMVRPGDGPALDAPEPVLPSAAGR